MAREKIVVAGGTTKSWKLLLGLRIFAFMATLAAAIVMSLNKETKTLVVATIGTLPIKATLTAKFQHTPAFVFFVIANVMVSFHNLLMIVLQIFSRKLEYKGVRLLSIAILDMLNATLVSAAANAAVFVAELGKNGNKHAKWNKVCDRFATYCDHGAGALIAAFAGVILMLLVSSVSISRLLINSKHLSTTATTTAVV
ncbi:Casparian strip membrane protein domain [Arabidopsis thaliana x Arabidopsis arenosa]|uniref:CASP-like protein n=2 Tax=Arabidopsis TaxID=3701 RepID=A0A8T1YL99_ARASU|nr:Casparian strip membrane protein domain [Arabidopsis thaliana x Arabidopsis arenosa]KAG7546794.1 Casparian strip membrane protein domain [Arabidopsis suecica]